MTNNIVSNLQQSPFDSIRRVDEDGEYWLGRELMPLLGYPRWREFEDAIDRAKASCQNAGNPVTEHFWGLTPKTSGAAGRPKQDYRLTRLACYLTAQNGDPRKSEVAAAQLYFTVRTREAEVNAKITAKSLPNYLPARKKCMDTLKDYGARGGTYGQVEHYNNQLTGIGDGERSSLTPDQAHQLIYNYQAGTIELLERKRDFAESQQHLANTAKKGMRHGVYKLRGENAVPEALKPRKERKLLPTTQYD